MSPSLPSLWSRNADMLSDPFRTMRRELDSFFGEFGRRFPDISADLNAAAPAINIAETDDRYEITAELPGIEEKDIKLAVEGNRLVIAGEKKTESDRKDKAWHVVERNYGAFRRAVTLPFEPAENAVEAHFDKGVLYLAVKKPAAAQSAKRSIEIKAGAPPVEAAQKPAVSAVQQGGKAA